ncbi:hypothetical protein NDR87_03225 [Nocardia sp. CDC159]|uniref:Uncharacterized protein n=1 Tax=Nocardia pulmonis TaxID=2951408 RepID=A0A9X2E0P8_9NOCA|nr:MULTISPECIES: hypothetical protein [Nocardia]MCM6771974.1 hypothetical protein [Nocardia pulmonis]MCM6785368.1 hypothetical protein [Nocardia sp. CDC159]
MTAESDWPATEPERADDPVYHFPVEVEVVGELGEDHLRQVAKYVFDQLHTTLRSRG